MIIKEFGYTPLNIDFNANSHRYKLGDMYLIGTTTVLGCRDKPFLMWWTTKENYKYMSANWDIEKVYTKKEKDELLLLAKKAWTVKKDKALDAGKIAHQLIQEMIEGGEWRLDEWKNDNKQLQEEVNNAYQAWIDWEKTHEIEYLATELIVGSSTHYTGGTIDAIAIVDGQLELLDWKTSKRFSDDVFLQLGAYKMMLLEGGVDPNIKRRTVRFDKTGKGFEEIFVKSDYTKDKEAFLALLRVYRWQRDTKKNYADKMGKLKTDELKTLTK